MTNQQILEKAIFIAESKGLKHDYLIALLSMGNNELIFNRDFAKALWPDNENTTITHSDKFDYDGNHLKQPWWQYNLQQMVIADDPIKYLGENIHA